MQCNGEKIDNRLNKAMRSRCRHRLELEDVFSAPKFFKIIADPTSPNLRIPAEFMKRHGRNLGNRVFLNVPSTSDSWEVELVHSNETLLQKGWQEFSQRYSLGFGHFLVFEYNGNSQFNVVIFDTTASEINYPDEPSETKSDDSIVVLEHLSSTKRKPKTVQDSDTRTQKSRIKLKKSSFTGRVQKNQKTVEKETSMAYQRAIGFAAGSTFHNPFYICVMQPSYIDYATFGLEIPKAFAKENLPCASGSATLAIKNDEKTAWPIKLYRYNKRAKISCGWKAFVDDNGLKVGDACLFEVVNHFHWNVVIFKS